MTQYYAININDKGGVTKFSTPFSTPKDAVSGSLKIMINAMKTKQNDFSGTTFVVPQEVTADIESRFKAGQLSEKEVPAIIKQNSVAECNIEPPNNNLVLSGNKVAPNTPTYIVGFQGTEISSRGPLAPSDSFALVQDMGKKMQQAGGKADFYVVTEEQFIRMRNAAVPTGGMGGVTAMNVEGAKNIAKNEAIGKLELNGGNVKFTIHEDQPGQKPVGQPSSPVAQAAGFKIDPQKIQSVIEKNRVRDNTTGVPTP